jgi:flagellar biogenesis protein FliO
VTHKIKRGQYLKNFAREGLVLSDKVTLIMVNLELLVYGQVESIIISKRVKFKMDEERKMS